MTEAAAPAAVVHQGEKEADHHAYFRPKDAATLILIDRSGAKPKVLVGKRHDKVVCMPGKFVFPGGRVVGTLSAASLDAMLTGRARLRQRPGPRNALGGIKFVFPVQEREGRVRRTTAA